MQSNKRRVVSLIIFVLVLAILISVVGFRREISDWWRLSKYEAPSKIEALTKNTTMNSKGKHLFYVAHPVINDNQEFNSNCRINEFSIVLGCYISKSWYGDIYLYDVADKRLDGVLEVTAAHEMLHVAYERLDADHKQNVDAMLDRAYKKVTDKRIKDTLQQYKEQDANSVSNELHSILGTEVASLSVELEDYYKQYFDNRQKIVDYSERYETEFSSRRGNAEQLGLQITSLKQEIEADTSRLTAQRDQINRMQQELDDLRRSEEIQEYNSRVSEYNQLINEYNTSVNNIKAKTSEHNELVERYNAISIEINSLYKSLDSTPQSLSSE